MNVKVKESKNWTCATRLDIFDFIYWWIFRILATWQHLRSSVHSPLIPTPHRRQFAERAFKVGDPILWNLFPDAVWDATSLTTCRLLRGHSYTIAYIETIIYDGYNISMNCYCKAPLRHSCSIERYINSRLLLLYNNNNNNNYYYYYYYYYYWYNYINNNNNNNYWYYYFFL